MTLAEKILARAAGRPRVSAGEILTCPVDLAMMHDSSGPRRQAPMLEALGAELWDPDRVVVITDHYITESDPDSVAIQALTQSWVAEHQVRKYHRGEGICHVVLPHAGHLRPGMFVVGGDSHSTTGGALGCMMIGIGATDLAAVLATGEIWVRVPATIRICLTGTLNPATSAKDIILSLCASMGINGANYQSVEYDGPAVSSLSMDERMVLTNMSAELGAKTAMVAPDRLTCDWLAERGVEVDDPQRWHSDPGAALSREITLDVSGLAPQVAAPYTPENAVGVETHVGTSIQVAYLGACTGAKLDDLRFAASMVRGRTVAAGVDFYVAPSSEQIRQQAKDEGLLAVLSAAGAQILPTGCGACIGLGPARVGPGQVSISSTSRNFRGRMGDLSSRTYLASPYTVAASAIAGAIADPRDFYRSCGLEPPQTATPA